ncbi:glycosyltransferase [soil metagenome]
MPSSFIPLPSSFKNAADIDPRFRGLRVALVHDWLNGMRGGERVLEHFCALFPDADLYTLIYNAEAVSPTIRAMNVIESPFANLPGARTHYRYFLALMPWFIGQLPTADYDLVISTSHCVAKGAPAPRKGVCVSYVFSPMRYVWDHYADYLSGVWWKDAGLSAIRGRMQRWDRRSCLRVDGFAADSQHIARKIERFWGRSAETIYPAVELERFQPNYLPPDDYFLVVAALVPYKKVERAIEAAELSEKRLVVVGSGPERDRLEAQAGTFTEFAGHVPDHLLPSYYQRCRALLYPGVEDYGITALEAQACGRPVLAYGKGGAAETVREGETGAFFREPSAKSLARLMNLHNDATYDSAAIRAHAEKFSAQAFRMALVDWLRKETRFAW